MTADTVTSEDLKPLTFSKGWTEPMSGTLDNLGYTVTFRPNASSVTTLQTHTGEYEFDHFHYHWGERAGYGSEHLVDGKQYDLEIHFVFKKVKNTNPNAGDAISVLGVLILEKLIIVPKSVEYGTRFLQQKSCHTIQLKELFQPSSQFS